MLPTSASPRLLIVLEALGAGGTERVTLNLAGGLAARGYAVELLVLTVAAFGHTAPDGIAVAQANISRGRLRGFWLLRVLGTLVRRMRTMPPDTVILTAMLRINWVVVLAAWLARRPLRTIAVEHTLYTQIADHTSRLRAALNLWLRRTLFRRFDGIVVPSHAAARALAVELAVDEGRITALPNAVVSTPREPRQPGSSALPIILAVGRLHAQKDYVTLIEAFALMSTRTPARLRIIGEGEQRAQLEQLVAAHGLTDRVELAGFVADPAEAYRRADLLVLSSRWEVLPTVMIEAMHHGCPVVATDCEYGPREILRGGRLGLLVPVGDARALARAMETALSASVDRDALRRRAAEYSVDAASAAYDAFLTQTDRPRRQRSLSRHSHGKSSRTGGRGVKFSDRMSTCENTVDDQTRLSGLHRL